MTAREARRIAHSFNFYANRRGLDTIYYANDSCPDRDRPDDYIVTIMDLRYAWARVVATPTTVSEALRTLNALSRQQQMAHEHRTPPHS